MHARTVWCGTREARLSSLVSEDRSYMPMVKSGGGQRESEGAVVVLIRVQQNAPRQACACRWGCRERNGADCHSGPSNVRGLQHRLWAAAKRSRGRRFHALYDRVYRSDVLWEAWERLRRNRGAAGVDRVTLAEVEACGVERLLDELQDDLRQGRYRPAPVRRVAIPKPDGGVRPLGIPTVCDRDAARLGHLLPYRQRRQQVRPDRPLRRVAAQTLADQASRPQPTRRTGRSLDARLVSGARPAPVDGYHPLSRDRVAMLGRSSVSRVRVNRTHGLKGEREDVPALRAARP